MRLGDFVGAWSMERAIEDKRADRTGSLLGLARFEPAALGLAYAEEGLLRLGEGSAVSASRRHLWREAGSFIEVLFEDGRRFHSFDASETVASARHDCPPDAYRVRYDFTQWPLWRTQWRVTGPRKDYVMETVYKPATTCAD